MENQTTIVAISTPIGAGAIGIVRMSGEKAIAIAKQIFIPYTQNADLSSIGGFKGLLGRIVEGDKVIDEAVVYLYRGPRSYTGEDLVEICCHGGLFLVQDVLRICIQNGAVAAAPGEFTKRAFLNGKLSLTQAEAVCDLITAQSDTARKAALSAKDGALSIAVQNMVEQLTRESAHLAAWADYPEEDIDGVNPQVLAEALNSLIQEMDRLLDTYDRGCMLREGVQTAIVGKPNVGKSTLMNLLAGYQRSIVTDIPGTTRDIVQEQIRIGDVVLNLSDTAGIRDTENIVEQQGVELAKGQIEKAGLILAVFDCSDTLDENDKKMLERIQGKPCIGIINKMDLQQNLDVALIQKSTSHLVYLSAKTGQGREELEKTITSLLRLDTLDTSAAIVANERQRGCVYQAKKALMEALEALSLQMTLDAVNVCIDYALDWLLTLTGERATDTVVDQVFAQFCVGK